MFVSWQWGLLETWFRVASSKCFNCKTGAWTLFYVGLLSTAYWNMCGQNGILSPLNCIIVHGFLHLCFSARYLLVILHVFQPRSCRNCSVQKLGCLRHLLVHPSATKIVFHLPRLKLPRLKFLLAARGSCLYCCPHPWFSVIYHFPLLLLRVVLKLHFIWKTWSHTTSADMVCSIKSIWCSSVSTFFSGGFK